MSVLSQKKVLLAVTGGIAAYKSSELVRLLVKAGADVQVIMTENAQRFVGRTTFEALSGHPVLTDEFGSEVPIPHIRMREGRDLFVIAPATANMLGKIAGGIADDLVSSTAAARSCPLLVAPAMNVHMWRSPAVQRNVRTLLEDGVLFSGPAAGAQACGDVGEGRMNEPAAILQDMEKVLTPQILENRRIVITGGPTFEAIDPVRGITNRSSGRQAAAIAQAAVNAGARVTLIMGPCSTELPHGIRVVRVTSALDMQNAVRETLAEEKADAFIAVAAVSDWRAAEVSPYKLKKEPGVDRLTIKFVKNPDILALAALSGRCTAVIGFAAETNDLLQHAAEKLERKGADLIVANPSSAIGSSENTPYFVTRDKVEELGTLSKTDLAQAIIEKTAEIIKEKSS